MDDLKIECHRCLKHDYFKQICNESNSATQLSKIEREDLFNEAERLRLSGHKNESASLYMRCLTSLEVRTAFPSLPKCLRALANHFLEKEEFVKSIHFVQAERLYYESALIDTAALQQKLTDMTTNRISNTSFNRSYLKDSNQMDKIKIEEYRQMVSYYKEKENFEFALEYAQKNSNLIIKLYGLDAPQTKEAMCLMHDLEVEMKKKKNEPNGVEITNTQYTTTTDTYLKYQPTDVDNTATNAYQSCLGFNQAKTKPLNHPHEVLLDSSLIPVSSADIAKQRCLAVLNIFTSRFWNLLEIIFPLVYWIIGISCIFISIYLSYPIVLSIIFPGYAIDDYDKFIQPNTGPFYNFLDSLIMQPLKNIYDEIYGLITTWQTSYQTPNSRVNTWLT